MALNKVVVALPWLAAGFDLGQLGTVTTGGMDWWLMVASAGLCGVCGSVIFLIVD